MTECNHRIREPLRSGRWARHRITSSSCVSVSRGSRFSISGNCLTNCPRRNRRKSYGPLSRRCPSPVIEGEGSTLARRSPSPRDGLIKARRNLMARNAAMVNFIPESLMLLRLQYACACSNKWETASDDNLEGQCCECGVISWPAEIAQSARTRSSRSPTTCSRGDLRKSPSRLCSRRADHLALLCTDKHRRARSARS
jgi:hypothetical protein